MNELTWIPADVTNDIEMLNWLEEQMARREWESFQSLSEEGHDEEDHLWACL